MSLRHPVSEVPEMTTSMCECIGMMYIVYDSYIGKFDDGKWRG